MLFWRLNFIWVVSTPCHTSALSLFKPIKFGFAFLYFLTASTLVSGEEATVLRAIFLFHHYPCRWRPKRVWREKSSIDWFSMTKHHLYCDECQFFLSLLVAFWWLSSNSRSLVCHSSEKWIDLHGYWLLCIRKQTWGTTHQNTTNISADVQSWILLLLPIFFPTRYQITPFFPFQYPDLDLTCQFVGSM